MAPSGLQSVLRGTGSCLPRRTIYNHDFPAALETSDEWIRSRTGIRERRIALDDETTSTLGLEAARRALAASRLTAADIDLVICATVAPDVMVPSVACRIQRGLECRPIPAFDLNAACTGFVYALVVADLFLRSGAYRNVMVVGSDTLTRGVDFTDRSTCILFGDGAGAVVLSAAEAPGRGLRYSKLLADGSDVILLPGIGAQPAPAVTRASPRSVPPAHIRLNGREVFKFAVRRVRELMETVLAESGIPLAKIDLVIPHQVNQRILNAAFDGLGVPPERVIVNLDRLGNTSAASVPIALDEAIRDRRARPGDTVLLMAFGGGMTWGAALLTL